MANQRNTPRFDAGAVGHEGVVVAVLVVAGLLVVAGGAVGAGIGMRHQQTSMTVGHASAAVEPAFTLAEVAPMIAEHYRYAADHPQPYRNVPCFCGCRDMLGHRDLYDCFVAPQGGWDPHASGCAVCTQESVRVRRMLERGASYDTMRSSIIERFGALTS